MPRRKDCFAHPLLLAAICLSLTKPQAQIGPDKTPDAARLVPILQKTADYCRKLENAVLDFVCLEEVKETVYYEVVEKELDQGLYRVLDRALDNTFLYEYQLIRNAEKTEESRTLIEKDGQKCREKVSGVGTQRFRFEKIVYGPVDLLKLSHQPYFDYAIVREERLPGDKALVIEAVPKPSEQEYRPFGQIWVRESDFAILKIDYHRRSIRSLYSETRDRGPDKGEPRFELTSEFDVEKNGIRFPSRLVFEEAYVDKSGKRSVRSQTLVTYKEYRFFSVTVDVIYGPIHRSEGEP